MCSRHKAVQRYFSTSGRSSRYARLGAELAVKLYVRLTLSSLRSLPRAIESGNVVMAKPAPKLTDDEIALARKRGAKKLAGMPTAREAWYDAAHGVLSVILNSGHVVSVQRKHLQELSRVASKSLENAQIVGAGTAILFDEAGVTIGVEDLAKGIYGSESWMAKILGAAGGRAKSAKKAEASRKNGLNGGRPPKMHSAARPKSDKEISAFQPPTRSKSRKTGGRNR